jgi:16S rRNA (cytosine1402-N4)-methyltransferase
MVDEVLSYLAPQSGTVVDATVGGGGHARAILERLGHEVRQRASAGSKCRLLGFDRDAEAVASARVQLSSFENVELVHASYTEMPAIAGRLGIAPVAGVLFDLGVSLHQLVTSGRGFGHDICGPLDMRFDQSGTGMTARDVVRRMPELRLRALLREFGEEPMSGRVARVLHERRLALRTTSDLAQAVRSAVPARLARRALARVFQALRIFVNDELCQVRSGLAAALSVLGEGGRLVVISYHSLEDRIVKHFLRKSGQDGLVRVLTARPVLPRDAEVRRNPRARSAKLRAAERLPARGHGCDGADEGGRDSGPDACRQTPYDADRMSHSGPSQRSSAAARRSGRGQSPQCRG